MMKRYFHTLLPGRAFQRIKSCRHVHRLLYTPFYHDHHHITWTRKRKLWKVYACPSFLLSFLHPPGNHIRPGWSWSVQQCFLLCTRFLSSLANKWFSSYCVFTPWTDFFLFVSFFLFFLILRQSVTIHIQSSQSGCSLLCQFVLLHGRRRKPDTMKERDFQQKLLFSWPLYQLTVIVFFLVSSSYSFGPRG